MGEQKYRVGSHQPQNLYRGNQYIGVMFDPADAAMIADLLNRWNSQVPVESLFPEVFRDADGDYWHRREGSEFLYNLRNGGPGWLLSAVKETYGTWDEGSE